eukprot:SAG22_NODE_136_length_18095_cov_19.897255_3_plen_85_part_00
MVLPPRALRMLGAMLRGEPELWADGAVQQALGLVRTVLHCRRAGGRVFPLVLASCVSAFSPSAACCVSACLCVCVSVSVFVSIC